MHQYLLFITIILFFIINADSVNEDDPTIIWVENEKGENVTSLRTKAYTDIGKLVFKSDGRVINWKINPELPDGLVYEAWRVSISGMSKVVMEETIFTITAISHNSTLDYHFPMSFSGCEYGDYIYPHYQYSGSGIFTLSNNNVIYYNQTIDAKTIIPLCIPQLTYDYVFICIENALNCLFYLDNDHGDYFLSLSLEPKNSATGILETIPTKIPQFHPIPLLSMSTHEDLTYYIQIDGVYRNITTSPALPEGFSISSSGLLLKGRSDLTLIQQYTITTSNALGTASTVFTLAINTCPQGLEKMMIVLRRQQYMQRWKIVDSNNQVLFDQEHDYTVNKHMICWTPGSYSMILSTIAEAGGWPDYMGINVYDSIGLLAEFKLPAKQKRITRTFNYKYGFMKQSEWFFTTMISSQKWIKLNYNEKKWKVGKENDWGSFSKDIESIYLRKKITLPPTNQYTLIHFDVKSSKNCDVTIYFNEQKVSTLLGLSNNETYIRVTLPYTMITKKTSIIAIQIQRAKEAALNSKIVFDMQSIVSSSSCILQSLFGTAMDIQEGSTSTNKPKNAFDPTSSSTWSIYHYPAILRFTFENHLHTVINQIMMKQTDLGSPTVFQVEGVHDDNSTVVLATVNQQTFLHNSEEIIYLDTIEAFPSYQIVYQNSSTNSSIRVKDIRFYSCTNQVCKKKGAYPLSHIQQIQYGSCSWFHTGKKLMHCIEDDLDVHWIEDTSCCLSTFPKSHIAYIDWTFTIDNMVYEEWLEKMDTMRKLITENLKVSNSEIQFIVAQDTSTSSLIQLKVQTRFTLEREIGDYILKHLQLLNFDQLIQQYFSSPSKNYHGNILEMKLHEGIDESYVITVLITIVICIIVFFIIYVFLLRVTPLSKRKTLQRSKRKEETQSLLLNVC